MKLSLPIDCACLRLLSGPECARMGHPTIARIPSSLRLHHRWGRPALHRPQAFVVCGDLDTQKGTSILLGQMRAIFGLFLCWSCANGFSGPSLTTFQRHSDVSHRKQPFVTRTSLQSSSDDVATVQLLISDTGGGHRASANALRDAFDVLHPGKIKCDIVDIYTEYGPFWPYNQYPAVYKFMAKYPITWDLFYKFGCTPFGLWLNEFLLELFCFEPFKECLKRPSCGTSKRADMVVSVHPLAQDIPLKILAYLDSNGATRDISARTTPFCTVVTDLGSAHPTWFNPGVDKCFVPSDALYQAAKDRQLCDDQIVQFGLPIRKGFWSTTVAAKSAQSSAPSPESSHKKVLRANLGLESNLPTVLVVGGGDGMGGIVNIAKSLGEKLASLEQETQMVVVCGSNQDAKASLSAIEWGDNMSVLVQGFVNNMDEWMKASDALVTKAGPGTIAEASICGLPCMMFSYLPGQEEGNIPFVEESGFGKYSGDPSVIADTVCEWLASPDRLISMQEAALKASRPEATLDIARDLSALLLAEKEKQLSNSKEKVSVRRR